MRLGGATGQSDKKEADRAKLLYCLKSKFALLQTHMAQDVRSASCTSPNNVFCLVGATDLTLPLALANIEQENEKCLFVVLALLGLLVLLS